MTTPRSPHPEILTDASGRSRYRIVDANHEKLVTSEAYEGGDRAAVRGLMDLVDAVTAFALGDASGASRDALARTLASIVDRDPETGGTIPETGGTIPEAPQPGQNGDLLPLVAALMTRAFELVDDEVETINDTLVAVGPGVEQFSVGVGPVAVPLTRAQAIRTACWLITLADPMDKTWPVVLAAVRNT